MYKQTLRLSLLLAGALLASTGHSQTHTVTDSNWDSIIAAAAPGDILQLSDSATAYTGKRINGLHGSAQAPITLKAETPLGAALDASGEQKTWALEIDNSSHLNITGLKISNSTGINGRSNYSPSVRSVVKGGLLIQNSHAISLSGNLFDNISSRGILALDTDRLQVDHNLFIDVGDDVASSAIDLSQATTHWQIRENLFASNVGAITKTGTGTGGTIDNNLILFNAWATGISLRNHLASGSESPASSIHNNLIYTEKSGYSGLSLQDSSQRVSVTGNAIYNAGNNVALKIYGRCGNGQQGAGQCLNNVAWHRIFNNWLLNRSPRANPGLMFTETAGSLNATVSDLDISYNSILGYQPSIYSWQTAQPDTVRVDHNRIYSSFTQADMSNNTTVPENSISQLAQADALMLSTREQALIDSLITVYNFSPTLIRKALNKGDIPWPYNRQCQASDDYLVLSAADAGLASSQQDGQLPLALDSDALGGLSLNSASLNSHTEISQAGKIAYRTLFTNPGSYQLYARLKCSTNCVAGSSLHLPGGLNTELNATDGWLVSEPAVSASYNWFNLGSYSPDTGLYNSLVLGMRDNNLLIDSLVLHKNTDLATTPATLDQLVQQHQNNPTCN